MKNPPKVDPINLEAAELVNHAADILVKEGWRTHHVGYPGERKCILGALGMARGNDTFCFPCGDRVFETAINAFARSIPRHDGSDPDPVWALADWNNVQNDGQVVIDKCREVAKLLCQPTRD